MTTIYLSDRSEFDIEREFYCLSCRDFRDVFAGPPGDIVCQKCYYVIASFKDREIVRSAEPVVGGDLPGGGNDQAHADTPAGN